MPDIFNEQLIRHGPWQEFERNTARLLLHLGWIDPKLVGRTGDGGADVLAVAQNGALTLFQCKFREKSVAGKEAIDEVRNAGRLYEADALYVLTSQPAGRAMAAEIKRLQAQNLPIYYIGPDQLLEASRQAPLYAPNHITPREYQIDAIEALRSAVLERSRGLLVLATGLGKTVVIAELVSDLLTNGLLGRGRVLVLAHTIPLINQLLAAFWRHIPKTIPTHRYAEGERPISYEGITFATIQSFARVKELPYFDLVIVDEAHHIGAPDYRETLYRLDPPKLIGVTATPWRADHVSLEDILGRPVMSMGIKDGLAQGFLSDVDYRIFVDSIDWDLVKDHSQHGYTIAHLNRKLIIPVRDEEAIREIRKVFDREGRKRGLVFSPSQVHARTFASELRRHGFSAESLVSEDTAIDRFKKIARFSAGKLQFLCAVDILNEGIDVPDVDLLVFMRVTHSRRIFVQQLGRGLRLSSQKHEVIVLDFAADIRRIHAALDLVSPMDNKEIERLLLSNAHVGFSNKSLGKFFYEWISDLGNIQDVEDDEIVKLPILDPEQLDFPEPFDS